MSEFQNKLKAALGRKPDPETLCLACNGFGQTKATRTEMQREKGKLVTTAQGSGCPECRGTGQRRVA